MRRLVLVLVVLAGCPRTPESPAPRSPEIVVEPPVAPTPWWTAGDKACPPLQGIVAGAAPGATTHEGHLVQTPGDIYCEAGGVANGPATHLYPGGQAAETGTYVGGKRHGKWTTFHPDGTVASVGEYYLGTQTGPWATWYPSKRHRDRGELQGGQRIGLWQQWDDTGELVRDPDRFIEFDKHSQVVLRGVYSDGEPTEALPACVIGLAYPACRFLPVVDLGFRADPTEGTPARGKPGETTLDLGGWINVLPHHSVGATFGWIFDAIYPATKLEARYRYWILRWLAAEAGAGRISGRHGAPAGSDVHVALVAADFLSLTFTVEQHAGADTQALLGLRFGLPALGIAAAVLGHSH